MSTKLNLKSLTKSKKIDSPLAKYNSTGQLFCVLCNTQVKNEIYWTGHVNGKAHKENLVQLKKGQASSVNNGQNSSSSSGGVKRPAPTPVAGDSIDKDANVFKEPAPKRVMFADESKPVVKKLDVRAAEEELNSMVMEVSEDKSNARESDNTSRNNGQSEAGGDAGAVAPVVPENIPQGFFDDPKEDAKARGVKFKDPQEVEWEKFVKEIATEDLKSNEIVGLDQEASAVDRELEQIEEQMVQWQRVIQLEKKAEELGKLNRNPDSNPAKNHNRDEAMDQSMNAEEDDDLDEDYDDELDWRNKKKR